MFDYDYIIPKEDYDKSLTKIPLGEIFNLKANLLQPKVHLKLEVTSVISLGDNEVTAYDVKIPDELKASGTADDVAKVLNGNFIETNGFAVVELKITAFAQDFWDGSIGTKTITVVIGNSTTKKEQEIVELKKQNEQALAAKDQQISELKQSQKQALTAKDQQISVLKKKQKQTLTTKDQQISELKQNQEQTLASKNQQINELKQNQAQAQRALKEAKSMTEIYAETSKDLLDKAKTFVSSSNTQDFGQVLQASFDKEIDGKLKKEYKTKYYNVQHELIDNISDKMSQLAVEYQTYGQGPYYNLGRVGSFSKDLASYLDRYVQFDRDGHWGHINLQDYKEIKSSLAKVLEYQKKAYSQFNENGKFHSVAANYIKSLDDDPSFINNYTIDPQTRITVKKFTIDKITNIMEFIELPEDTIQVIYCDHTPGDNTAGISYTGSGKRKTAKTLHKSFVDSFKTKNLVPGKPDTVNMFTFAAKLKNGNITMPETFLSKTPALSGGK